MQNIEKLNHVYTKQKVQTLESLQEMYESTFKYLLDKIDNANIVLAHIYTEEQRKNIAHCYNERLKNLKEFLCSSDKIVRFEIKQSRNNKYWGLTLYIKPIMGVGGQTWLKEDVEVYNFPITIMFDNRILVSQTELAELEEICATLINKNQGKYENTFDIGLGLIPRVAFSELNNHNTELVFDNDSNIFIDFDSLKIIKDGNEEYLYEAGEAVTMQYSDLLEKLIDNIVYLKQSPYMLSLDFYERSDTQDDIDFQTHDSNIVKFMSPYFMNNSEDN